MNRLTTAIVVLLACALPARSGETALTLSLTGELDAHVAEQAVRRLTNAARDGATLLLEIDVSSAPSAFGLQVAHALRDLPDGVRTVVLVTGRAPASALAIVLAADRSFAIAGARFGPVPDGGPVGTAVREAASARGVDVRAIDQLSPLATGAGQISAEDARRVGLIEAVVTNRAEAVAHLGLKPLPSDRIGSSGARRTVVGTFTKPFRIPIDIAIDDTLAASVARRIEEGKEAGADLFIFEIDSPGGLVNSSMDIGDMIYDLEVPSVMLILRGAYSGAALIALAGDEMVMGEGGIVGDCQPIMVGPDGYTVAGEKLQSPLRATFRKYSTRNGYPVRLAESMVTEQMEVFRATFTDGAVLFVLPEEIEVQEQDHGAIVRKEIAVKAGELLTLTAEKAMEYGFTGPLVSGEEAFHQRFDLDPASVTTLHETWAENLSRFLLRMKFLLFFVGIIALYMELKAPGLGLPGAIALICFVLFFTASSLSGIATSLEIVLFVLGVALLAVELLVIPGFGVPGIAGAALIFVSLYMASIKYGLPAPDRPWEFAGFLAWMRGFSIAIVSSLAAMVVLARYLPKTVFGRALILAPEGPPGSLGLTGSGTIRIEHAEPLLGRDGIALTDLRPAGRIDIDDEPYDAVTQGDYISAGELIRVLEVRGNRIVVKRGAR
jgi:membrane-bound serine protease (ClpP class)